MAIARLEPYPHERVSLLAAHPERVHPERVRPEGVRPERVRPEGCVTDAKKQNEFLFTAERMGLQTREEGQDMETNDAFASFAGPRHVVLGLIRWARTRSIYPSEILVDSDDDEIYFREHFARDTEAGRIPGGAGAAPHVVFG